MQDKRKIVPVMRVGGSKWWGRLQRGDISAEPDSKDNTVFLLTVS